MPRFAVPLCLGLLLAAGSSGLAPAQEAPALPTGQWIAEEIGGTAVTEGIETSFNLGPEGRVSGSGGCNRYSGPATIDGDAMSFGPVIATKMACESAAMSQEQAFFGALASVRGWTVEDDKLHLLDEGGATLVLLGKAPTAASITIEVPNADAVETAKQEYSCGEEFSVLAEYFNAGPVSLATLTFADDFVVTANVLAASGAKYAGGKYIWWTRDEEADLYDLTNGEDASPVHCTSAAP